MIKTYTTTVKAEVFDGSKEMMSRYPVRGFDIGKHDERWVLDMSIRGQEFPYPSPLSKGQYIVTTPTGKVINMWPNDFYDLFPEAEK
ncbi:MAG TPA: hypothetical protein DEQ50_06455 [Lactobacillus sp.]|nr:hypothetical protein [Lactobacillus sp.]